MTRVWQWTTVIMAISIGLSCEDRGMQELKTTDWVTSDDGVLSIRLSAYDTTRRDEPIVLIASLRNNSDQPVTVGRTFGNEYYSRRTLQIIGNRGPLPYTGDILDYELGTSSFVVIAPGEVVRDRLEVGVSSFAGLARPGTYYIIHTYRAVELTLDGSAWFAKEDARRWQIESALITVRRK